ncbi:MAG: glycine cleavage system aminomethyltransferase GcvT [Deltaproteobacteria bacterium]|nr:glycine cleavage system aminomethyltransferase GcvT [Deltaproteobacteria bacterium]MBI3294330.1 glycine cleavage system aminomethyltransferase GcvT [Deltaproteobacteria bacterium]
MPELAKTPLHTQHVELGARMVPFAGYSMPVQYSGLLEETKATRATAGLFDVSHMGQFWVRGKAALEEIQAITTNDLNRIQVGQAQYNMLCNPIGGVIDDIIVYRRHPEDLFICVNASNRHTDFDWVKGHLKRSTLTDESDETALIALQGPQSEAVLMKLVDPSHLALKYYWACESQMLSRPIYLSRTGYTGEDGFEIYCRAKDAPTIWDTLLDKGHENGLVPCGLGSRDTLRTEMGYPLHGHELSAEISPIEAGLSWVVKFTKSFVGDSVLKSQVENGPTRILKGLQMEDRRIARPGYRIFDGNSEIGVISSGTFSPHRNAPVALGFVELRLKDAPQFEVQIRGERSVGRTTPLPFVPSRAKR